MARQLALGIVPLSAYAQDILAMMDVLTDLEVPENGLTCLLLTMDVATASQRDLWLLHCMMKQLVAGFTAIGEVPPREILDRASEVKEAFLRKE